MKASILLFVVISFFCFLSIDANAQTPDWLWAQSAGDTGTEMADAVAVDASGNLFVTGKFTSSTLSFGSTTLTNTGMEDIFLAKYDADGNVLWAKSAEGTVSDVPSAVVTDDSGNIYLTGRFKSSTLAFGAVILTNSGNNDIFLVKYDADGNVLWAKCAGGINYESGNAIAADALGNIYIAGYFSSPTITFGSITLTNVGSYDMFLAKFDAGGNALWAISVGDSDDEGINSVVADALGNTYVTGYFSSPTITFGSTTLTNLGSYDVFLAKFDAGGNVLWAKSAGGTDDDEANAVATDASGNVYGTGYFSSPAITFGSTTLTNAGIQNMYLVKYDSEGNVLWAKSAGGTDHDIAHSVAVDVSKNSYMTGYFESPTIDFGSTTLTNSGNGDMFLAMFDTNGNVLWAKSTGGTNFDEGNAVATDISGNIYSAGYYSSTDIAFGATTLFNAGNGDMFCAKLESSITGVDEVNHSFNVSIFPNPATNKIAIETNITGSITIVNTSGQQLLQQDITGPITTLDVSGLSTGVYMLKVVGKESVQVGKFIKK